MRKISFYTLGCKLNQSETAVLAEQFKKENYEIVSFGEAVDVCVINTCTVTAKSDRRCLQTIRRVKKENPLAKIAVVGCYAQLNPEKLKKDNDVDFILGSDAKFDLFNMLDDYSGAEKSKILASKNGTFRNPQPGYRSEERRVGKECRSRWSPYH